MHSRNAIVCALASLILALLLVAPAFAQGATDNTNVCHPINPLHSEYFNRPCENEFEWQVGWCLSQVFQHDMKFVIFYELREFNSASQWRFLRDWKGNLTDYLVYPPNLGFYAPLCRIMFSNDKTLADFEHHGILSESENRYIRIPKYVNVLYPGRWDYFRDLFQARSTSDPDDAFWVHRRALLLMTHAECLAIMGLSSC